PRLAVLQAHDLEHLLLAVHRLPQRPAIALGVRWREPIQERAPLPAAQLGGLADRDIARRAAGAADEDVPPALRLRGEEIDRDPAGLVPRQLDLWPPRLAAVHVRPLFNQALSEQDLEGDADGIVLDLLAEKIGGIRPLYHVRNEDELDVADFALPASQRTSDDEARGAWPQQLHHFAGHCDCVCSWKL